MHTSNVREQATRERVRKERARESERERALSPGGTRSSHSSRRFGSATHRGEKRPRHDRRPGREKKEIPQPGRPNARDGRLLLLLLLPTAVVARRLGRLLREVFGANRRVFPGWMTTSWYRVYCQLGRAQSARCTSRDDGRRRDGETTHAKARFLAIFAGVVYVHASPIWYRARSCGMLRPRSALSTPRKTSS